MRFHHVATLGVLLGCAATIDDNKKPLEDAGLCTDLGCFPEPPPAADCGDGVLSAAEACDDGNQESGDGCRANCLSIEPGWSCYPAGQACRPIARCGDGVVTATEPCDDGNRSGGDGCSATCKLELGHKCEGSPSQCSATTCGDGKREGAESCDDNNALPFDGCSADCQTEPNCSGGACTSSCGDGLVLKEECDDGNRTNGDGCSRDCRVEQGHLCANDGGCSTEGGPCLLRVPVVYRDFEASHSDFGVGCGQLVAGVVRDRLDARGRPVLANGSQACIASADSFREWYTSSANNATIVGELTLYEDDAGGFVNRYGPAGEPWRGAMTYANVVWGGPSGSGCAMCTPSATGACFDPCVPHNSTQTSCCAEAAQQTFAGNPLFFPIDDSPLARNDARHRAKVPEEYGYNGWPWEDQVIPNTREHNFHFTTEVVYWFPYDASVSATLDFLGDDDVWVFLNGRLAVDLGGPHVPSPGSITIDQSNATRFGLEDGEVYEIRVFHAERKIEGSSFKLTLASFNTLRSECTPICGDGIVTAGEECDDTVNDGGYEECAPGCVLGESCGDGIVQEGEDCDDGNRVDGDGCGSSCRTLVLL